MCIFFIIIISSVILFLLWRLYFLRDPERIIPHENVVVAPADGIVLYIKKVENGTIPLSVKKKKRILLNEVSGLGEGMMESGFLVGIFMSPMSVHRNRIPLQGKIILKEYREATSNLSMVKATTDIVLGRAPLRDYEFYPVNERQTIGIETVLGNLFVTQIADKWIKKIICRVELGDKVNTGDQYGMIRFGSQCDLFIPECRGLEFKKTPGDKVKAGSSIIANF